MSDEQTLIENVNPNPTPQPMGWLTRGQVVNGSWLVMNEIGRGAFGTVHVCQCVRSQMYYAMKVQRRQEKRDSRREHEVLRVMSEVEGFPLLMGYGLTRSNYWVVMSLLDKPLSACLKDCRGVFSINTTVQIGDQILSRIEDLHSRGLLHRDVKPDNFLVGASQFSNTVYMVDFGLASSYLTKTGEHIPYRSALPLVGTVGYMSLNCHCGIEQSRRDDLESFIYMLINFMIGTLPWYKVRGKTLREKQAQVFLKKNTLSIEDICKDVPPEFTTILRYIRALSFSQDPDYDFIRGHLRNVYPGGYFPELSPPFDWQVYRNVNGLTRLPLELLSNVAGNHTTNFNFSFAKKSSAVLVIA